MSFSEQASNQKKITLNNENSINNESSEIKIVEETTLPKTSNDKYRRNKAKDKIKNAIMKKTNNEVEIVQEKNIVKAKTFIDNEYINNYDPMMQDHNTYPKLKFFIDTESVSETDKDLSSASLSSESKDNNEEEKNDSSNK